MTLRPAARLRGLERTLIRRIHDTAPAGAIDLGLGEPDLPTLPAAALAGAGAIADGRTRYSPTAGEARLRSAVAELYGIEAGGDRDVLICVGSQEALFLACFGLVEPGREVLVPDPGYPAYPVVARLVGGIPVGYPLRPEQGFRLRAADVEQRLTDRTALVVLNAPGNPTGAIPAQAEVRRLCGLLERRGIPWLSDEIYEAFAWGERAVSPSGFAPTGGLVVSGVSKSASMTGWRVGWLAGPAGIVRRLTAAHQYLVTCASGISQAAALAALGPEGLSQRDAMLASFERRRKLMADGLAGVPDVRFELPDGAFYFFVDFSHYGDAVELSRRLVDRCNVVTIPGDAFGPGGSGYLRLSFTADPEAICEGVARIAEELKD